MTLVQTAVRPDGKERTITQRVPVQDALLLTRLVAEVIPGAEIGAMIVTEWHKSGYTTYLAGFHPVSASLDTQITASILAKAS